MAEDDETEGNSLLAGRRAEPLSEAEIRTVANTFYGMDRSVDARHDPTRPTGFRVEDVDGEPTGVISFGSDIYPGPSVADPNAALSMTAAVAHELSHYHRWKDNTELPLGHYRDLDEAFTSLDAMLRFARTLSPFEMEQLARDAVQRLQRHRRRLPSPEDRCTD